MQEIQKISLLTSAKQHVATVRELIQQAIKTKEAQLNTTTKGMIKTSSSDAVAERIIVAHRQTYVENLKQLYPSPYFSKCVFETMGEKKIMYFGKFSFSEEQIYSWTTPAAALRFEHPGQASYARPNGSTQSGTLVSKDSYMIVDGKLMFYATESMDAPRELVYQEHFTRHKQGFVLPEVVEQMEKAQDQVVRAPAQGPLVISGPAGSGKTTLALHRVAYLAQSPETAEFFTPETTLIMVQDQGTKEYFSHLLPDLGIHGITIRTFAEWAMELLHLTGYTYMTHYGENETTHINYEYNKLSALRRISYVPFTTYIYAMLQKIYDPFFTVETKKIWLKQKQEKVLDRFDLTVLLLLYKKTKGDFALEQEYYVELHNGTYVKRKKKFPLQYNLAVVDEFQNYLPEQIQMIKDCLNHRLDAVIYVGDLAQQTQLGTLRDWSRINEQVQPDRLITLQKVYRNTAQILRFTQELGYPVNVPVGIKEGKDVAQIICPTTEEEIAYVQRTISSENTPIVGILAKEKTDLSIFKNTFADQKHIFCLSFQEAQGVEFDQVFIVGIHEKMFDLRNTPEQIAADLKKIWKDLLYVALTRAMSELHIIGSTKLRQCMEKII